MSVVLSLRRADGPASQGAGFDWAEVSRGRSVRRAAQRASWWKSSRTGPKRGP